MRIEFPGRTAIVTGAAHGIGRAIARALADAGASVRICDLDAAELAQTAGGRMEAKVVDVADRAAVRDFVAAAGRVDVLVNNAGGVVGQVKQPLEEVTPEQWRAIFDANLGGALNFTQAVAPGMKAARGGRIVNISSGAGLRPSLTGIQAYAAAKHAVVGFTKQMALELGPFGITVNSVAPGFIRSNPSTEKQWESYGTEGQKRLMDGVFMRRPGRAEDIANAVLFLASEHASWISGQVLSVDGGRA
jgi:3-oxoacyl-[acyl-carrier protein] reductase